ncbi:DUF6252 domain-containing protein [Spirosoma gilvum]
MKTTQFFSLLAIASVLTLSSCSKKSDDSVTPNTQQTQSTVGFKAKVDGASNFAPDFAYALASFPGANGYYAIYGLNSQTSDVVAIALPNTAGEGTYQLSNVNVAAVTLNKGEYSTVNGGSGTVTISKKTDTNITGTFSFTAFDAAGTKKITFTEGTFNVAVR